MLLLSKWKLSKSYYLASIPREPNPEQYRFNEIYVKQLEQQLTVIYDSNTVVIDKFINTHIRPSGNYALYHLFTNKELWQKAWQQYFTGINYIIDQYGLGKMRYPHIDSASYDVSGAQYQLMLDSMFKTLQQPLQDTKLFYESPLLVAMQLMRLNHRDEAARYEPLEKRRK